MELWMDILPPQTNSHLSLQNFHQEEVPLTPVRERKLNEENASTQTLRPPFIFHVSLWEEDFRTGICARSYQLN
jgi:hypothetical protein